MRATTLEIPVIIGELARLTTDLNTVKRGISQTMGEAVRDHQMAEKAAVRFAEALEREAQFVGKTAAEAHKLNVELKATAAATAGFDGLALRIRSAGAALEITGKSSGQVRQGMQQLSFQMNDVATSFAGGVSPLRIFAQQSSQVLQAVQLMTGEAKGFVGFLAGPWGAAITAGLVVLTPLVSKLFDTGDASKRAAEGLKTFQTAQSDIGNFIDATTGRLKEQNAVLIRNAILTRQKQIDQNRTDLAAQTGTAFDAARAAAAATGTSSYAERGLTARFSDTAISQVIVAANGNVEKLDAGLAALARRRPELNATILTISNAAGQAVRLARENEKLGAEVDQLTGKTTVQGRVTAGLIEKQVAYATATTAVEKARAAMAIVEERGADATKLGGKALDQYRADLTSSANAVNRAEAAERAHSAAKTAGTKATTEAAKASLDASKQTYEYEQLLASLTAKYDPATKAAEDYAKGINDLKFAVQSGGLPRAVADQHAQQALLAWGAARDALEDKTRLKVTIDYSALDKVVDNPLFHTAEKQKKLWDELTDHVDTAADHMADAFGRVGGSIGDAMRVLADYGKQQSAIDESTRSAADKKKATDTLQLNSLIGLTGAAKGFFRENSAGYKAMEAAQRALTVVQLARTAVDVAGGAAAMFKTLGPLGFPAVAAMLGVMASLGFSSGGSAGSAPLSNQGGGTILGDGDAKSESIQRSLDSLNDLDAAALHYAQQMTASLKAIETNIGGLAKLVVRSNNINASTGITEGFKSSSAQTGLAGAAAGGIGYAIAAGSFAGPVGIAIGAALGLILSPVLKSLFGSTTKVTGSGLYAGPQSLGGILDGGLGLQTYSDIAKTSKFFGFKTGTKYSTQYGQADADIGQQFTMILAQFNDAILAAANPLGEATSAIEDRLSSFVVDLGRIDLQGLSGTEINDKLTAIFGAAADNMASAAFPGLEKFQRVGEGAYESLIRVASTVEAVTVSLDQLGLSSHSLGIEASMAITGMFDSVSDYQSAADAYFKSFYTEAEQAAKRTEQLTSVFTSLGMALPDSIANYRNLVEAQDLTTDAGQQAYATLLKLAPAFAEVQAAGDGVTGGLASAAAILREREGLEQKLLEMSGDTVAIRAAELAQLDPSNRALQERIYALSDEATAAQVAAQAAADLAARERAIADERAGLERQLLDLTGQSAAIRALDLAKLDASNQALQLQIWALTDQTKATQDAAAAAEQAAAAEKAIGDQRLGLMREMWQLTGDTASVRADELAQLDPSNRALKEQIYALQDQQAAAAEAQRAAEQAASAAKQLADAWSSIADSILDEVKRIRGLNDATSPLGYASLLGQFNDATSGARAGDQDAAKSLPELSKALLDVAASTATSRQELDRVQAVTASSLEETARLVDMAIGGSNVMGFGANDNNTAPEWLQAFAIGQNGGGQSDNAELISEVRSLRAEVAGMRSENNSGNAQIAGPIKKLSVIADAFDGEALTVRDAA